MARKRYFSKFYFPAENSEMVAFFSHHMSVVFNTKLSVTENLFSGYFALHVAQRGFGYCSLSGFSDMSTGVVLLYSYSM